MLHAYLYYRNGRFGSNRSFFDLKNFFEKTRYCECIHKNNITFVKYLTENRVQNIKYL
jgi:hypothetical protein